MCTKGSRVTFIFCNKMNPKGSPVLHFSALRDYSKFFFIFLDKFFNVSNVSPFTFDILQQIGSSKIPKGPLSPIFGIVRFFKMIIFSRRFSSEKSPTITVSSFFRQTTDLIVYVPLFTETDKTTQAKFGQWKRPKGPPFNFFRHCAKFFSKIF